MAITLNQIAEICGVSRGTVDRALHNKGNVRPAVAERIKAVANEYGYNPNRAGLALSRTSHPIRIGVIMFSVQTPFMQIVLDAARREARRLGRRRDDNADGAGRTGLDDRESGRAASYQCAGDHAA